MIEYFDNIVERIRTIDIKRLDDYNCIETFPDYEEFNIVIGNDLYEYDYEIDVDSTPLSLKRTCNNKYNINLDKSGIYYNGIKVGDL